jgi:hypothetical protein
LASVTWDPEAGRPTDAADLEREIERAVPLCQVKVTRIGEEWRVRALAPPGFCGYGRSLSERDVSKEIAEILVEAGYPARA